MIKGSQLQWWPGWRKPGWKGWETQGREKGIGTKVLMVETGGWGGIGHYAHCLCNALAAAGCEVRLATHASRYALQGFAKAYAVDPVFRGDGQLADWRRLLALCGQHRPQLLHFQSLLSTRRDWLMFYLLRRRYPQIRRIVTVHNVLPHETAFGERTAYRRLYHAADGLIVHSEVSRQALRELMGDRFSVPLAVIPHGHYGELAAEGRDRTAALAALELPDARYLSCFGAIRPYKGVDWLLRAVAAVDDWPDDARVLVIGHLMSGVSEASLRNLSRELGIGDRVVFRFGYVPEAQIPDVFAISDAMLLPYRHIDQSGVLMAALAAGKPVVCTPVGAFPEVVGPDVGFVSAEASWPSYAEALTAALKRRAQWPAMGERASQLAERDYGWDAIAASTTAFYDQVLARAGKG